MGKKRITKEGRQIKEQKVSPIDENGVAIYHNQLIFGVTIAGALLLLLSNFNMSGTIGRVISSVLFGLFGLLAYISPIVLVAVVGLYLINKGTIFAKRKFVCSIVFIFTLCSILQLPSYDEVLTIAQYYQVSSSEKRGGGIIGGFFCKILYSLFGFWGSFVILILLSVVCMIVMTEKPIFDITVRFFQNGFGKSIKNLKEEKKDYAEEETENEEQAKNKKRTMKTFTLISNNVDKKANDNNVDKKANDNNIDKKANDNIDTVESVEKESNIYEVEFNNKFGEKNDSKQDVKNIANSLFGYDVVLEDEIVLEDDIEKVECEIVNDDVRNRDIVLENEYLPSNMVEMYPDDDINVEDEQEELAIADNVRNGEQVEFFATEVVEDVVHAKEIVVENEKTKINENKVKQIEEKKIVKPRTKRKYEFPDIELLTAPLAPSAANKKECERIGNKLIETLESFGVNVKLIGTSSGPVVTRYEIQPAKGVKVSKITNLTDDIKLNLAAAQIRIEAPIPGKAAVGIEVPNKGDTKIVHIRELIESREFKKCKSSVAFAVGKDISGQVVIADIAKMPHLLIAGQTGSGKSVCINTLIMSILYKANPDDVKLIMIDPKVVELSIYNGIPHLLIPVVTDPQKAAGALNWAVTEMVYRYKKFAQMHVRDINSYNEKIKKEKVVSDEHKKMHQIVIIVDELADLMMVAPDKVEDAICRLAQMARAAGIHLIIATQRPSVNVITGLIKANIPSRIAFSVASAIDSRTILDGSGAEKLLSRGDMLFFPTGYPKPVRVQGAYISDKEVGDVVEYLSAQNYNSEDDVSEKIISQIESEPVDENKASKKEEKDEYFIDAGRLVIEKDKASIGMLQRMYRIGFNRASRLMDQLYEAGVVGADEGTKARSVLMTSEDFETKYVNLK